MKAQLLTAILTTTMVYLDNGAELTHCQLDSHHEYRGWWYVCQESSGLACGVYLSNKLKPGQSVKLGSLWYSGFNCEKPSQQGKQGKANG